MYPDDHNFVSQLVQWSGVSGLIAFIAGLIGYGKIQHQIQTNTRDIRNLETDVEYGRTFAGANAITLARLEERLAALQSDTTDIKAAIQRRLPS